MNVVIDVKPYYQGTSIAYCNRSLNTIPGGYHSNFRKKESGPPIYFVRGKKGRLWDMDGNEYLDLYAKSGAMFLGHSNPQYKKIFFQPETFMAADYVSHSVKAAETVLKHFDGFDMIRFCLSGNEAVQNVLRLARAYTGKNKFIRFQGHFHGTADNVLGGITKDSCSYTPVSDEENDIFYTKGRAEGILQNQSFLLPWNDICVLKKVVEKYKNEIAAVIMEPINLNGGGIMPRKDYLQQVREICSKNHILLIFDEVITGIRMGLGGAQKELGIRPDIIILGKALGGGYLPVSAFIAPHKIMDEYKTYRVVHGGTFNAYPLSMLAITAVYDILEHDEKNTFHKLQKKSTELHKIFIELSKKVGLPLVIQGPATCSSYHVSEKELTSYEEMDQKIKTKNAVLKNCLQKYGILTAYTSRIYTNITLSDCDIDFFEKRAYAALKDTEIILERLKRGKDF